MLPSPKPFVPLFRPPLSAPLARSVHFITPPSSLCIYSFPPLTRPGGGLEELGMEIRRIGGIDKEHHALAPPVSPQKARQRGQPQLARHHHVLLGELDRHREGWGREGEESIGAGMVVVMMMTTRSFALQLARHATTMYCWESCTNRH
jgi:hypothetical protein